MDQLIGPIKALWPFSKKGMTSFSVFSSGVAVSWQLAYDKIHKQDRLTPQSLVGCKLSVCTDSSEEIKALKKTTTSFPRQFWVF